MSLYSILARGSVLSATFTEEALARGVRSIDLTAIEVDPPLQGYLRSTMRSLIEMTVRQGASLHANVLTTDFIHHGVEQLSDELFREPTRLTHVIMNPPYKKIRASSDHRRGLQSIGIEATNLYAAFLSLAIRMLDKSGELVAIIPRSFCNGPYFKPFRQLLLDEMAIFRIHLFETRKDAFKTDEVLQENLILHAVKGSEIDRVTVTTSARTDFALDTETGQYTVDGMTQRTIPLQSMVDPNDPDRFLRISACELDQIVIEKLSLFNEALSTLGLTVSTGPVVDFRVKDSWCFAPRAGCVPLLYAQNFDRHGVAWPKRGKKPVALQVDPATRKWLWPNDGCYVLTKRFSSKEERRRVVAWVYESDLPGELIAFENHLNVFHIDRRGLDRVLAHGLAAYLNSSLVDRYFRS